MEAANDVFLRPQGLPSSGRVTVLLRQAVTREQINALEE